jgi:hypothetical protein
MWVDIHSLDTFTAVGKTCFVVENPVECADFSHIIGHNVRVDGVERKVVAVERATHLPPWKKGELISLVVD